MVLFLSYVWNGIFSTENKESINQNCEEPDENNEQTIKKTEENTHQKNKIIDVNVEVNNFENDKKISIDSVEKIVFEGGGVKGIAFLGSLSVIRNQLQKINAYAGTSVGSIAASLFAIGYNLDEVKDIMWNTNFKSFFDHEYDIPIDVYSLFKNYGICSGDNFKNWISSLIEKKTNDSNYTFKQLFDEKNKDLVITTSNISYLNPLYISYRNYPNMPIKDAIRMSMSIPLIFSPILFEGNYYADGGIIDNYPIHVFDGKYPGDIDAINYRVPINKNTLGFRLIGDFDDTSEKESNKKYEINSLTSYGMAVFDANLKSSSRQYNGDKNWNRSIPILVHNISSLDFGLTEEDKKKLYQSGIDAALEFFKK